MKEKTISASPEEAKSDEEVCKLVNENFLEAKRFRATLEEDKKEAERFYRGKQWKNNLDRPVNNLCFTIIETEVPILTDSRPGTDVIPHQQQDQDRAKVLDAAIDYVYDNQNVQFKLPQVTRDYLIGGEGWMYVDWDPDKQKGEGEITITMLNWRSIFPDPNATDIDDAAYVGIKLAMRVNELKRRFPDKADEIKPMDLNTQSNEETENRIIDFLPDSNRNTEIFDGDREAQRTDLKGMTILEEMWVKDFTTEEIPEEETLKETVIEADQFMKGVNPDISKNEDHAAHIEQHTQFREEFIVQVLSTLGLPPQELTDQDFEAIKESDPQVALMLNVIDDHIEMHETLLEQNPDSKRPKYPNNMRLILKTGNVILYDGPSPVEDGMVPLVPFYCYKQSHSMYAISELKNLIAPQKSINEMNYAEYQGLMLNGNSGWVKDAESGVDEETLTNEQGLVVTKKQGTEVSRIQPGQVSPQFQSRQNADKTIMELVSGITENTQGKAPDHIVAAKAMESIKQQSVGRVRLKSRQTEEYSMLRLGKLTASRVVQYWSTERILRVYDNNGKIQFIDFDPEDIQKLNYEVRIAPGSTAGLSKTDIFMVMKELAIAQIIDPETMIEATDVPHKSHILDKLAQNNEKDLLIQQLSEQLAAIEQAVAEEEQSLPPQQT